MPPFRVQNGRKLYKFKKQLFGAKNGCIMIFDERDGSTAMSTITEFLARAEALGLEAARCVYGSERTELENAANDMEACAAEAADQGDPTDPEVLAYRSRHKSSGYVQVVAPMNQKNAKALPPPPKALLRGGALIPGLTAPKRK